jgi:hypothetical protein
VRIAQYAFELAELHAAELHATQLRGMGHACDGLTGQRAKIIQRIDDLAVRNLPLLADRERYEIRGVIDQIARTSVLMHRALRALGGRHHEVHILSERLAALVDLYTTTVTNLMERPPYGVTASSIG